MAIPEPVIRLALQAAVVTWSKLTAPQKQKVVDTAKTAAIFAAGSAANAATTAATGSPMTGTAAGRAVRNALGKSK